MGTIWSQSFFLPEPILTEKNLPDQTGKVRTPHSPATLWHSGTLALATPLLQPTLTLILQVHIITGGYTGIGFELAQILYAKNSTVYIAGRSSSKGTAAISTLKAACPTRKAASSSSFSTWRTSPPSPNPPPNSRRKRRVRTC